MASIRSKRKFKRALAGVVALIAVALFLCFGLRTPLVLGPISGPFIEEAARSAEVELQVGSMVGVGWTGVRLHQVVVKGGVGDVQAFGELRTVDIYPDLWGTLKERRPKVKKVVAEGGQVSLARGVGGSEESGGEESGDEAGEVRSEHRGFEVFAPSAEVEVRDFEVALAGVSRAVKVEEALATLSSSAEVMVEGLEVQGSALGRSFSLVLGDEELRADLSQVDLREFLVELPAEVELAALAVSREELGRLWQERTWRGGRLALEGLVLRVKGGPEVELKVGRSELEALGAGLRWRAAEAGLFYPGGSLELREVELRRRRDVEGVSFQGQLVSGAGGHIEVEGQWHGPTSLVSLNAWMHDYIWESSGAPEMMWELPVKAGRLSGAFHGDVDLIHGLVNLDGRLRVRDLALELALLAKEPLLFEEVRLALPLTVDLKGRALSVAGGRLAFGEMGELGFHGYTIDAGGSYAFELAMYGEEIEASQVAASLPAPLLGGLVETEMAGQFGVSLSTKGHTAEPESLVLEVSFSGDVEVGDEAIWAELEESLEGAGEEDWQLFRSEYHRHRPLGGPGWTRLSELPAHVWAAILSAEDATFFEHEGLDWTGLRMAMVHNIKEGALIRGGSTISQQVAKNLFLTPDRRISRKLQEAFLTWRVESVLTKEQILELYLNVAQWGPDVYGIGGAAAYYFDKEAGQLTVLEAATLAAILPNPMRFGSALRGGYLPSSRAGKVERVLANMRFLEQLGWAEYYGAMGDLERGRVGDLELLRCGDDEEAPAELVKCSEIGKEGDLGGSDDWELARHRDPAGWVPLTH